MEVRARTGSENCYSPPPGYTLSPPRMTKRRVNMNSQERTHQKQGGRCAARMRSADGLNSLKSHARAFKNFSSSMQEPHPINSSALSVHDPFFSARAISPLFLSFFQSFLLLPSMNSE